MSGLSPEAREALLRRAAEIEAEIDELPRSGLSAAKRASKAGLIAAELREIRRKLAADSPDPPPTPP